MGKKDHKVSAIGTGCVNSILNHLIDNGAVFTLSEIINEFTVFLEEGRGGGRDAQRSSNTDKANLDITEIMDDIRFEEIQFIFLGPVVGDVAVSIFKISLFNCFR